MHCLPVLRLQYIRTLYILLREVFTTLNDNTIIKLTFCLVSVRGSIRTFGDSELPRVLANRAALFLSFNPSTAVTAANWLQSNSKQKCRSSTCGNKDECVTFRSGTDLISLFILLFLLGWPLPDEFGRDCSSRKCTSNWLESDFWNDSLISRWVSWRHFMQKCSHLVNTHTSVWPICSSVYQFLIHSTFVLIKPVCKSRDWSRN